MLHRSSHLLAVAAVSLALGCADNLPTSPTAATPEASIANAKGKRPGAKITGDVDQTVSGVVMDAVVRITRFDQSATGQVLATGVVSGTADGAAFTQAFSMVPATLSSGPAAAATAQTGPLAAQLGECDILLLDLGPLHLDLLGLEVDLARVVLDIDAQAGAGNLVGNLLCAVVHLLDGPALFAALANLLEQINAILAAF